MVCAFNRIREVNEGIAPALHPILAALQIVLNRDEDLIQINIANESITSHMYFDPEVDFPDSLDHLLTEQEERWWEQIDTAPQGSAFVALPRPPQGDEDVEMTDGVHGEEEQDELADDEPVPPPQPAAANQRPKVSDILYPLSLILTSFKASTKAIRKGRKL